MIVVLCGIPCSGKSTIVGLLRDRLQVVHMIVSDDISSHTYQSIIKRRD